VSSIIKLLRLFPPEFAHNTAIFCLRHNIVKNLDSIYHDDILNNNIFDLNFKNPIGLAAGFDKNAECINSLCKFGFGFIECGAVTPKPQYGNKKPRIFRLTEDRAIINRLGFNNKGLDNFKRNLINANSCIHQDAKVPIGVNIGKNKGSNDPIKDYVLLIEELCNICSYITLNVSSPNTANLRDLQKHDVLDDLLTAAQKANKNRSPLLIKISPNIREEEKADIVNLAIKHKLAGIVIANTTTCHRKGLRSANKLEYGGLSGPPLFSISAKILSQMHKVAGKKLTFIASGGVENCMGAYKKIKSGASLVQIYTAFVYQGFGLVNKINKELAQVLRSDGFSNITEAVGSEN
jgi:dihydroorotate dehydrogenase